MHGNLIADPHRVTEAHKLEAGKARVETLISGARRKKPHPDFPKDKSMELFRVLKSVTDGNRSAAGSSTVAEVGGDVKDADSAKLIMEKMKKSMNKGFSEDNVPSSPPVKKARKVAAVADASVSSCSAAERRLPPTKPKTAKVQDTSDPSVISTIYIKQKKQLEELKNKGGLMRIDEASVETMENLLSDLSKMRADFESAAITSGTLPDELVSAKDKLIAAITEEGSYIATRLKRLAKDKTS